jgi:ATP-dependent helicase Lhr and Lhr-like helicase
VFCDSRARVEEIAVGLRERAVHTFVSHSSVSADERRQAERAFAAESNCVIVATSTLELGIDIGDLDRVIQVGAPTTVSSYLQRLGRTGRRPGTTRNLLFLTTDLAELWLASALTLLWSRGYVEDVVAPVLPRHIVAQQILGLVLQERRLVTHELAAWLGGLVAVDGADEVLHHLVRTEFVVDEGRLISIGPRAKQEWGRRYFADLTSAFTSEPMLEVVLGRRVLGYLPPLSLAARPGPGGLVVLLAGRAWDVLDIDWRRKRVLVAASEMKVMTLT